MTKLKTNGKKIFFSSILIIILQMIVFTILWDNPVVKDLLAQFDGHPSIKSYEFIGGENNWRLARMFFHIAFMAVSIWIFLLLYDCLPHGMWKKGLGFGALIGFFRFIPETFNLWSMIIYPEVLIILRLVLGMLSFMIFGVLVSIVLKKFGAIVEE